MEFILEQQEKASGNSQIKLPECDRSVKILSKVGTEEDTEKGGRCTDKFWLAERLGCAVKGISNQTAQSSVSCHVNGKIIRESREDGTALKGIGVKGRQYFISFGVLVYRSMVY